MRHSIRYEAWTFDADKIREGNIYLATSLLSSSLEVNSLIAVVECEEPSILNFERNTKLLYYKSIEQPMVFRVQNIERVGPTLYRITATSTLGLLSESTHYGGVYDGTPAEEIIASICGTVAFQVKSNVGRIKLYGWLPIASARDNLAQVLLATGAALKTDLDGVLRIEPLWDGISGAVSSDQMYVESTVAYAAPVTAVTVTEHQYIPGQEEKSLFEGTALEEDIITFQEPMHSLSANGFSILEAGDNWAKLSAGTGVLTGKTYIHNTREVTKAVHKAKDPNVKAVKDATLVSLVNSNAVANRLVNFYKLRETISAPVIYRGEQPGDRLNLVHPFDRVACDACLQSVDITLSNTVKAEEKSLVGFVPEQATKFETYNKREVLTTSREWIVPDGVHSARVILIGGGHGGYSGAKGGSYTTAEGLACYGGKSGAGGSGGKVFQFDVDLEPGETYQITVGKGGRGGIYSSSGRVAGEEGQNSLFGNKTSADGSVVSGGFYDHIAKELYATSGINGISGGDGGAGGSPTSSNWTGASGRNVTDATSGNVFSGGLGGKGISLVNWGTTYIVCGGGGGGAAFGASGGKGTDGVITIEGALYKGYTGVGGIGGSAIAPQKTSVYGGGGHGGHGGGGGGKSGSASGLPPQNIIISYNEKNGGSGSNGGDGGDGVVIIYYSMKEEKGSGQLQGKNGKFLLDKFGRRIIV